jgi:thiol-disulfide isomerase/thioredoxin
MFFVVIRQWSREGAMLSFLFASSMLALSTVVAQPAELWEFTSPQCGACRQMEPILAQLKQQGWPVRQIDADQESELAQQVGIQALPTFVAVADGQIVGQKVGRQSAAELVAMLQSAGRSVASKATPRRPDHLTQSSAPPTASPTALPSPVAAMSPDAVQQALRATVRLRIEDANGLSFGTGTIVDVHEDEVLVLTCAHIFNASEGKGPILCDLFVPGAGTNVPGKLISRDIRRDVGLVSVRTRVPMEAVRVGGSGTRPAKSMKVCTIGCNRGADPTVETNQILAINRYHGPANLVVGGRPMDGRSGGGLFDETGTLIGVCNAADQQADEGLYAALGPIHTELDSAGLGFVYRNQPPAIASRTTPNSRLRSAAAVPATAPLPTSGATSDFHAAGNHTRGAASSTNADAEVICIVRTDETSRSGSQVYVLDRPSPNLMRQISAELDRRGPHALTQARVPRESPPGPQAPRGEGGWRPVR